ncbi:MAG TPA: DUF1284 domain-containing protein [Methanobacterium sp.]|nr:DUF1284 domain-containing protein [Methanobacterium sp.]
MKIRAHHLLCMQGFQGYGYSEDFSKNMAEIIEILQNFPKHKIEIIAGTDVICAFCPYNINGSCQENHESLEHKVFGASKNKVFAVQETKHSELRSDASKIEDFRKFLSTPKSKILMANNRIMSMDVKVLKKLGISSGSIFEAEEIFNITNKKLKTHLDVEDICGNCRWSKKCLWYLKKFAFNTNLISK